MAGSLDVSQQIQSGTVLVAPARSIGGIIANATLEEIHSDDLEITEHPIDQGASVTDHAYMRPREVMIRFGFSNSQGSGGAYSNAGLPTLPSVLSGSGAEQVDATYQKLLAMQATRQLINVFTARRKYSNMLIKSMKVTTNKETENALIVEAVFRQVILVTAQVATISAPPANQTKKKETSLTDDKGSVSLATANTADSTAAANAVAPGSN
jgi:hypothetical protein